jgi:hypothetical protein
LNRQRKEVHVIKEIAAVNPKIKYIVIAVCSLFVIYMIGASIYSIRQFMDNPRFTIGTIDSIKNKRVGLVHADVMFISYNYRNGIYHSEMEGSGFSDLIGKRIFVQISPTGYGIGLGIDCLVPDSLQHPPFQGWNTEWMKNNFPDCYLVR